LICTGPAPFEQVRPGRTNCRRSAPGPTKLSRIRGQANNVVLAAVARFAADRGIPEIEYSNISEIEF
jgi:hypothetical protein